MKPRTKGSDLAGSLVENSPCTWDTIRRSTKDLLIPFLMRQAGKPQIPPIHHKWNILLQTICPSQMLGKNLVPSQSFRNPRHYFSKLIEQLHFYTKIINETQQAWQNFRRIGLPIVSKLGASQFFVASRDPAEVHGLRKCILPSGSLIWSKWSCKPTMDNVPIFRKVIFEPGSRKTMRLQPQI